VGTVWVERHGYGSGMGNVLRVESDSQNWRSRTALVRTNNGVVGSKVGKK